MNTILFFLSALSLFIWVYLLLFRGGFWLADQQINVDLDALPNYPAIAVIIPAREEADVLPETLPSLLTQDYPGKLSVILVDDRSSDGTADVAQAIAEQLQQTDRLQIITGDPLQPGWSGKLWAMEQGVRALNQKPAVPDYLLFTDADIKHHSSNLKELVQKAVSENLELTSLMVLLRCESFWEKSLIPAFVFFFQKLYPFPWANDSGKKLAAAAGGCILIRREALNSIGGLSTIRETLIDDCSLAAAVKSSKPGNKIWLGLTEKTESLRPYPSLASIWNLVARTAFTQLNYSLILLLLTVMAMGIIYLIPPVGVILGIFRGNGWLTGMSLATWILMVVSFLPTLKLYRRSPLWGIGLPAIAGLYTLMTIDSAIRHWQGRGGGWKGRVYAPASK